MPRTFAIGDIHGHSHLLGRLLTRIRERAVPGDRLVFVGDYMDREPDSRGVVERVVELCGGAWEGPVVTLLGNPEDMLLDELRVKPLYDRGTWRENGGLQVLKNYVLKNYLENGSQGVEGRRADDLIPAPHLDFSTGWNSGPKMSTPTTYTLGSARSNGPVNPRAATSFGERTAGLRTPNTHWIKW